MYSTENCDFLNFYGVKDKSERSPRNGQNQQQKPIPPSQGFLHSPVLIFSSKEIFYSFTAKMILE